MSLQTIWTKYQQGEKLACLTAYDASFAKALNKAGVDIILVGDSLGMVIQGHQDTLSVSMKDMIYHTQMVQRGNDSALIIADMPFNACRNADLALKNAGKLVSQGGAEMVKVEGGLHNAKIIEHLVNNFIPVCGHVGLRPQQVHQLGGFRRQGKTQEERQRIMEDAKALVDAGCSLLLFECISENFAKQLTNQFNLPTVGIGCGKGCSGQILVSYDVLGLGELQPWFSKNFLAENDSIEAAFSAYVQAVKDGSFPN